MGKLFVEIADYIISHPDCKNKRAYDIYNAFFASRSFSPKNLSDVKLVLDYIDRIKLLPEDLLLDARKEIRE